MLMDVVRKKGNTVWTTLLVGIVGGALGWYFFDQQYSHALEIGVLIGGSLGWIIHRVVESLSEETKIANLQKRPPQVLTAAQQLSTFFRPTATRSHSTPTKRSRITQKLTPISTPRRPEISASPERKRTVWE